MRRLAPIVLALTLAACGAGTTPVPSAEQPVSPPVSPVASGPAAGLTLPFGPGTITAAEAILGDAGVAVYPDAGGEPLNAPAEPVSSLGMIESTAAALAAEAATDVGVPGSVLDAATGSATTSALITWASRGTTAGRAAHDLLGDQPTTDPAAVVVTPLALALFAADRLPRLPGPAPTIGAPGAHAGGIRLASLVMPVATDACTPVAVSYAEVLGRSVGATTDRALAAIALLAQVVPMLEGRTGVTLKASPPVNAWATAGGPAVTGTVMLHAGDVTEWTAIAGAPCLPFIAPSGPITWHFLPADNATVMHEDQVLSAGVGGADASLAYRMATEPTGATQPAQSAMTVFASYHHVEVDQLDTLLRPYVAQAPPVVASTLAAMLANLESVGKEVDLLATLPVTIPVTYHVCGPADACASVPPHASAPASSVPIPLPDACHLVTGDDVAGLVGQPAQAIEDPDDAVIDPAIQSICGYVIGDGSQGSARLNVSDPGSLDAFVKRLSPQPLPGLGDRAFTWDIGAIHGVGVQVGPVVIWATIGTTHLPASAAESMVRLAVQRLGG